MISLKNLFLVSIFLLPLFVHSAEEAAQSEVQNACNDDSENRITRHKDLYFIYGEPNTKVQISLKVKLMGNADLFLGYTQTMFWDLGHESSPFRDVDYNPELFYRFNTPSAGILKSIDLGIYEHRSNGRSGADSRAWSRNYLKFNTVSHFYKWTFNWDTKIFALYSLDPTNRDISDYTGFWETKIYFVNFFDLKDLVDRAQLYFSFFSGGKFSQSISKGGQELGFKVRLGGGRFTPSVFAQLYHGYNESLLDYKQDYFAYRLGLAF
jgi:phospholipase A1/A2